MLHYSTRMLIIISFVIAIFLRFYQIDIQGFLDSDEFAFRLFIDGYWKYHNLEGIAGSFWGRPTAFLLDVFLYNLFGIDPLIFLIRASICGILLVFVIYLIARNYFDMNTAIFASAIAATLFTFVYYSRNMKFISLSYLLVSLCLYFFFYYIKKKKINEKLHIYFGLCAALSITSHPNTIPIILCIIIVYFLYTIIFEKINFFKIFKKFLKSFLSVIITLELLFVLFRILPSFSTHNISSFIKFVLFPPQEIQGPTGTIVYYLNLLYLQERWFFILSIFSTLFAIYLIVIKKSFTAFSLLFISFFPIVLYILLGIPAHLRNILSSLVPLVILNAWFLSNFLKLIKNKYLLNLFLIFITLSILYPAKDVYSKISNKFWSYEKLFEENNGPMHSALYIEKKKSLYHVTGYYFTNRDSYVSNWDEVWQSYFCKSADNLILYSKEKNNEIYEFNYSNYETIKILNSDGTFYDINYLKLDNILKHFNKIFFTNSKVQEISKIPTNNFDNLKEQISKNIYSNIKSIKLKLNKEDNFFTLKGKFEKLKDEQFIIISLGTKSNPFYYDVKFIQNKNLSGFKKKYINDFFKFGWNVNDINKEELYLYIFTSNVDSDFIKKIHLNSFSTIKKYSNLHSCNKIKSSKDLKNKFTILNDTNKNLNILSLKDGKNILLGEELKPNQKYKLKFKVRYGLLSMARASVLLGPKYIIDQTFFLPVPNPFYLSKKIIFTTPASLTSNDEINLLFVTQQGLRSKFKNIILEEVNK